MSCWKGRREGRERASEKTRREGGGERREREKERREGGRVKRRDGEKEGEGKAFFSC